MTRKEAIEILRHLPINIGRQPEKHLIQEAMNMAIEALEEVNYWHDKATNYEQTIINLSHSLECGARMKEQELLDLRSGKGLDPMGPSEHGITYE